LANSNFPGASNFSTFSGFGGASMQPKSPKIGTDSAPKTAAPNLKRMLKRSMKKAMKYAP